MPEVIVNPGHTLIAGKGAKECGPGTKVNLSEDDAKRLQADNVVRLPDADAEKAAKKAAAEKAAADEAARKAADEEAARKAAEDEAARKAADEEAARLAAAQAAAGNSGGAPT